MSNLLRPDTPIYLQLSQEREARWMEDSSKMMQLTQATKKLLIQAAFGRSPRALLDMRLGKKLNKLVDDRVEGMKIINRIWSCELSLVFLFGHYVMFTGIMFTLPVHPLECLKKRKNQDLEWIFFFLSELNLFLTSSVFICYFPCWWV